MGAEACSNNHASGNVIGGDGGTATGVSGGATDSVLGGGWDGEAGGGRVTKSRST